MEYPRRKVLHLVAGAAALPALSLLARAQSYPSRPVRWLVGFTPADFGKLIAEETEKWAKVVQFAGIKPQ